MNPPNPYTPGIDVSHYQGVVDWEKVKAAGIQFAFLKATDGAAGVDPMFARNVMQCCAAGIAWGAYHFFRPAEDAAGQATNFLKCLRSLTLMGSIPADYKTLPPVLDLEIVPPDPASYLAAIDTWLDAVDSALTKLPAIYTGASFGKQYLDSSLSSHPLWLAEYGPAPHVPPQWDNWEFWQHSATGTVDGIVGEVDLDWFHGTLDDLMVWVS